MAHESFKLVAGVDHNKTLALNEGAISQSNLIRFMPDRGGFGLVQKLGGWSLWSTVQISSKVRCLKAWQDLYTNKYLGVGAETSLSIINGASTSSRSVITPTTQALSIAVDASTTVGSPIVTLVSTGVTPTNFDVVHFKSHISVGGIILFGLYQCIAAGANSFQVSAKDVLHNQVNANATVASGGAVETFTTINTSSTVTVTLNGHGYEIGDTYTCLTSTAVGGVTIYGEYNVISVPTANTFTIIAKNAATSGATVAIAGGLTNFLFYFGSGPSYVGTGYGRQGYGKGGYGTGVTTPGTNSGTPITVTDWSLDNWGQVLISCPPGFPIFTYDPSYNFPTTSTIANGPPISDGVFVAMPQQQIIAWGSSFDGIQDPLLIRWSDLGDYNTWIAGVNNQAGSKRLSRGSGIVGGMQAGHKGVIWTDLGVWTMNYIGYPDVYNIDEVEQGCGLIARKAMTELGGVIYWMSQKQFFMMSGNGVEPVDCPVWDIAFQDLDLANLTKIRCAANSAFNEVAWYLPVTGGSGENSIYVKLNVLTKAWDYGTLDRTAWINQSTLGPPIGAGADNWIYQHEVSNDAASGTVSSAMNPYFQTGYIAMTQADVKMFVDQIWPDMKWGFEGQPQIASVQITFYAADYPGDTPRTYGPFTMTQATKFVTPRLRGRLISIKVESSDFGSFWRIGNIRYRVQQDGRV